MKKKNKIIRYIVNAIIMIVLFVVILLCNSAQWLLDTFGKIDFSTVLYQLNSPLKGTGHEILYNYILNALVVSIVEVIIVRVLWHIGYTVFKHYSICWKVKLFDKSFMLAVNKKKAKCLKLSFIGLVAALCTLALYRYADLVGIPKYIEKLNSASTLFEEEFVEPDSVEIKFPDNKKNLIYIYLESMEATYASTEVGGGKPINYIPNLTKLAGENISFSNDNDFGGISACSGTGWTMAALLASTTGVPYKLPVEGNSVGDYENILPGITSLGDILEDNGYANYFMCGSDADFGGRKDYFEQHGDYQIYDYYTAIDDGVIPEDYYEFWGIEDKKLYQYAKDKLSEIAAKGDPFNFTMLTVDTHHINGYICSDCNEDEYEQPYANVIKCADKKINEFIDWIQEQSWYEDTVVVVVGDHNSMNNNFWDDLPEDYIRTTYNCFINVDADMSNISTYNRSVYSMDLLPTVLGAMNVEIEGNRLGLGTNLFSGEETLAEKMGIDNFESEVGKYSNYYVKHFIENE
jgi:phosphoglycerol transferase